MKAPVETCSKALRKWAAPGGLIWALCAGPLFAVAETPLLQIGVEVVEVDEQKVQKLGVQWFDPLHVEEQSVPSLLKVGTVGRSKIFADLQALLEKGGADLLANPKLVTRDGTTATFHAGGELPYVVGGSLGTVNVVFKPYGVRLKINPRLERSGKIALVIEAEVSSPDTQNAVTLAGNMVPGIRTRQLTSELSLVPGTTLSLAGLLQNQRQWKRKGIPGLMNIPVLKYLFSHKVEENRKTSIVVFVTPSVLEGPPQDGTVPVGLWPALEDKHVPQG